MASEARNQEVGRRVAERRSEIGLGAQPRAAALAGVSQTIWSELERGVRVPATPTRRAQISRVLGWTETGLDDLLAGRQPTIAGSPAAATAPTRDGDRWRQEVEAALGRVLREASHALTLVQSGHPDLPTDRSSPAAPPSLG